MSTSHVTTEDPLLRSSRREMWIATAMWLTAMVVTLTVSLNWGYGRDPATLTYVLGFPDWIFWGVIVPWVASTVLATLFSLGFMQDFPLGDAPGDNEPS
jgi:hypothetical protein